MGIICKCPKFEGYGLTEKLAGDMLRTPEISKLFEGVCCWLQSKNFEISSNNSEEKLAYNLFIELQKKYYMEPIEIAKIISNMKMKKSFDSFELSFMILLLKHSLISKKKFKDYYENY